MKFRHKITTMVSAAAALVVIVAVAALAAGGLNLGAPKQDIVLGQQHSAAPVADAQEIIVYSHKNGTYYHAQSSCSGMKNAPETTLTQAETDGKKPCPVCIPEGSVYSTENGSFYHVLPDCSGMKNAYIITVDAAEASEKRPCPACIGTAALPTPMPTPMPADPEEDQRQEHWLDGMLQVYASQNSRFYHAIPDCSGMENASVLLSFRCIEQGQEACPLCIPDSRDSSFRRFFGTGIDEAFPGFTRTVTTLGNYSHRHGAYLDYFAHMRLENAGGDFIVIQLTPPAYGLDGELELSVSDNIGLQTLLDHSYEPFGDLTNELIPLYLQRRTGSTKSCPVSSISISFDGDEAVTGCSTVLDIDDETCYLVHWPMKDGRFVLPEIEPTPMPEEKVFASEHSVYYHSDSNCAGMRDASEMLRREAMQMGKQACPVCMDAATPLPIQATPGPTSPAGTTIPPTATLTPIPEFMMARSTPEPTPTPWPTSMPVAVDEECSGMSFGIIGGADGPTSIFITRPEESATPVPIDYPSPTENITLAPLAEAFSRIIGMGLEEAIPGYILDYAEGYPTEAGSSEAAYSMWQFTNSDQTVVVSLLDAVKTSDGVLSINFPDSAASFRMMKQANEPLRTIYMKLAPQLLEGLAILTGGDANQNRYLWDAYIHFNARFEITAVELVYAFSDASTAHFSWSTGKGEPRLYNINWIG